MGPGSSHERGWALIDPRAVSLQYTRTLSIELKHDGWALEEVMASVGNTLTVHLWHDARHAATAQSARVACSDAAATTRYDASLVAHVVAFAVDATQKRSITIVFPKGSPALL